MKERPVIFSADEVRATRAGLMTQFRRPVKAPERGSNGGELIEIVPSLLLTPGLWDARYNLDNPIAIDCPFGVRSDVLYVREAYCLESCREVGYYPPPFDDGRPIKHVEHPDGDYWLQPHYRATDPTPELDIGGEEPGVRWKSPVVMPKWASRLWLEITEVKVEQWRGVAWDFVVNYKVAR